MKRLSVIIVTYHSEKDIYDCLESVWKYCDLPHDDVEVVVVDNSPESDGMFSRLREAYGEEIVLIHNTHNGGYGQGNNVGIRRATAPVAMIMNPDVRLVEPVFKTAVEAFERDPELCLYGMKQKLSDKVLSMSSFACTRMMNGYAYTLLDGICNRLNLFFPRFMYLQGSCFFLRKDKFEAVGMFDETNFMYGEEDDIAYRIRQRFGNHAKFNPNLHYLHLALRRAPDVKHEIDMLEANAVLNEKKGYGRRKTLKNKLRNIRFRLWREQLKSLTGKGKNQPLYEMLTQFKDRLDTLLAKEDEGRKLFYINPMSYRNSALYDYNLLSNLEEGFRVTFFGNAQYDAGAIPTVTFKPLFSYSLYKSTVGKALSYGWSLVRLAAHCLCVKPDVVHIQWIKFPVLDTLLLRLLRLRGIRVVYTAHNVLPHADNGHRQQQRYGRYYRLVSDIIVHSATTKQELVGMFGIEADKIKVIPHGLIKVKHNPERVAQLEADLRRRYPNRLIFSSLGFQKHYKGVSLLTKLWSEEPMIARNDGVHLIIAGKQDGSVDTSSLEGRRNVTVIDRYIDDDEYMALSNVTDVMLMPYLRISQSGVLIAAINEHIPILVSNVGGLPDALAIADVGWNMGEPTYENLRQTLLDIIAHPEAIEAIRHDDEAWRKLEEAYSWEEIGKITSKLYIL